MPIRVAYVVEYPTPYDVPLFERIANRPEIDFTALFLSDVPKHLDSDKLHFQSALY